MVKSDTWKKRPCVVRYWQWCNEVRNLGISLPESGAKIIYRLPMPNSWSKKKKLECDGKPHQQTPDIDNLQKALQDAILANDCKIWDVHITKLWAYDGSIEIIAKSLS